MTESCGLSLVWFAGHLGASIDSYRAIGGNVDDELVEVPPGRAAHVLARAFERRAMARADEAVFGLLEGKQAAQVRTNLVDGDDVRGGRGIRLFDRARLIRDLHDIELAIRVEIRRLVKRIRIGLLADLKLTAELAGFEARISEAPGNRLGGIFRHNRLQQRIELGVRRSHCSYYRTQVEGCRACQGIDQCFPARDLDAGRTWSWRWGIRPGLGLNRIGFFLGNDPPAGIARLNLSRHAYAPSSACCLKQGGKQGVPPATQIPSASSRESANKTPNSLAPAPD